MASIRTISGLPSLRLLLPVIILAPATAAMGQPIVDSPSLMTSTLYPSILSIYLKDLELFIRVVAILLGAVWAYFKFVKGRVFHSRLEPSISGTVSQDGGTTFLIVKSMLKNVGLSKVNIEQKGSGLRVLASGSKIPQDITSADWTHLGTFPVFEGHGWIEPGEPITEERLILLSSHNYKMLCLELKVSSEKIT